MAGRRPRRSRRRTNRRRPARMSAAPPRKLLTSNTRKIVLSYTSTPPANTQGKLAVSLTVKTLFTDGTNAGIAIQYRQARIHSAKFYWQSDHSTSDSGSYALMVAEDEENTADASKVDFGEFTTFPGVMVRKVWQNVSNRWFPTEPSDREFREVSDSHTICSVLLRHSSDTSILKGRLIATVSLSVRGRQLKKSGEVLRSLNLIPPDFEELAIGDAPMS